MGIILLIRDQIIGFIAGLLLTSFGNIVKKEWNLSMEKKYPRKYIIFLCVQGLKKEESTLGITWRRLNLFAREDIVLSVRETMSLKKDIYKVVIQTSKDKAIDDFINEIHHKFAVYNNRDKDVSKKISEIIICSDFDKMNDKNERKFLEESAEYIFHTSESEKFALTNDKFIFLWYGKRLKIPYASHSLCVHGSRLHLLIQNFLDYSFFVISTKNIDSGYIVKNYNKKIDKLEETIKRVCSNLEDKLTETINNMTGIREPMHGRISLFYFHDFFNVTLGKALVPYFSYTPENDEPFRYWNTEELAMQRTLYKEGCLHVGKCYLPWGKEIRVYVLSDEAIQKQKNEIDEDLYVKSWKECHPEDDSWTEDIEKIVKGHKTCSQVHSGIRICAQGRDCGEHDKRFVLCFDIKKLPLPEAVDTPEAQQFWQTKIFKMIDKNYAYINSELAKYCKYLEIKNNSEEENMQKRGKNIDNEA